MSLQLLDSACPMPIPEPQSLPVQEEDSIALGIGKVLRELRRQRDLSLNELAQLSGVSRSMLSQMETGRSVPSVLVLCKIARSFDVPVTVFLGADNGEQPSFVSGEETPLRISADGKCAWRCLMPASHERKTEFYEVTLRGGGIEAVQPYPQGVRANLALSGGTLIVALGRQRHRLTAGDVLEFAASAPHSYINPGNAEALLYLVLRHQQRFV
ncbi:MAG: helix-turn-helix domain-containing protein [Candidatus Methylumidiphilus sp.]